MNKFFVIAKSSDSWFQLATEDRIDYKDQVAKRDGLVCSRHNGNGCGRYLPVHMMSIDHIVPISMGGPVSEVSNMQLLCFSCHRRKTRALDKKGLTFDFLARRKL
jgi:5-methylcytosine-specific restriction endonuclease McrA